MLKEVSKALEVAQVPWGRGRLGVIGQGRAGKTSLLRAILDQPFVEDVESTVGMESFSCNMEQVDLGGGLVTTQDKNKKRLEDKVAKMIQSQRASTSKNDSDVTEQVVSSRETETTVKPSAPTSPLPSSTLSSPAKRVKSITEVAPPVFEAAVVESCDYDVVKRYLKDVSTSSSLQLSIVDFGGQLVFAPLQHLFMSRNSVYVIVFNMEWFASSASEDIKREASSFLTFWINAVVVHTYSDVDKSTSPILFVGTHKDVVSSVEEHERISRLILNIKSNCAVEPVVITNRKGRSLTGTTLFQFFPIDCKVERNRDTALRQVLSCVDSIVSEQDYVTQKKPFTWIKFCDTLKELRKSYIGFTEACSIAQSVGIPAKDVEPLLQFLHESGDVMWFTDTALRSVVILDPIDFFVRAATMIIRKHSPGIDGVDKTHHDSKVHEKCRRFLKREWSLFTKKGVLKENLFDMMLEEEGDKVETIKHLMIKFGLLVEVMNYDEYDQASSNTVKQYIVPSVLPASPMYTPNTLGFEHVNTCMLLLSMQPAGFFSSTPLVSKESAALEAFLPQGLFSRLLGKLVGWSQETSFGSTVDSMQLSMSSATLWFGNQTFRVVELLEEKVILLEIEGLNPVAIQRRVEELLANTVSECMPSLHPTTLLPAVFEGTPTSSSSKSSSGYVVLSSLQTAVETGSSLRVSGEVLSPDKLKIHFKNWLPVSDPSFYDIMLSYRWTDPDHDMTGKIFDRLTICSIGKEKRPLSVFLDRKRIADGSNLKLSFADGLMSATVVVCFVSIGALQKMRNHDASVEDNVLIEWILALECFHHRLSKSTDSSKTRVEKIYPVFIGSVDGASGKETKSFFDASDCNHTTLPSTVPTASISRAATLLQDRGITPRPSLATATVRGIVIELTEQVGFKLSDAGQQPYVSEICKKLEKVVTSCKGPLEVTVSPCTVSSMKSPRSAAKSSSHADTSSPSAAPGPGPAPGPLSLDEAFALLRNPACCSKVEEMEGLLTEHGVTGSGDLAFLDVELISKISSLLRTVPKRRFEQALSSLAQGPP